MTISDLPSWVLRIPNASWRSARCRWAAAAAAAAQFKFIKKRSFVVGIDGGNNDHNMGFHVKEAVEEEEKARGSQITGLTGRRLTFCVEGNISVGKSTFLGKIAMLLSDLVEVVSEPVAKWRDVEPGHCNILDAFYAEPQKYAYIFQSYVLLTRILQERESARGEKPLRLMERSIFSDRMVFAPTAHEATWMSETEMSIYTSWFDLVVSCIPRLVPDGFIYLRACPAICHERMLRRGRTEERCVTLSYLWSLHEKLESWLFPSNKRNHSILTANNHLLQDNLLCLNIKGGVFHLEGKYLSSRIHKIPVLVLDYEPNVDFNKEMEAAKRYAHLLVEFFELVKNQKLPSSAMDTGTEESGD